MDGDPLAIDDRLRRAPDGTPIAVRRLSGHHLRGDGQGWLAVDCYLGRCSTNLRGTVREENGASDSVSAPGHALCSCGTLSGHLPTGVARRGWHREHKARVLLGEPEPAGQPTPVAGDDWA